MTPAKDAVSCETGGTACGKSFGPIAICSEWPALITAFVGNTSIGSSIGSPGDTGSPEALVNQCHGCINWPLTNRLLVGSTARNDAASHPSVTSVTLPSGPTSFT